MQYMSNVLQSAIIITLFPCIVSGVTGSGKPDLVEQTIEAIRNCMEQSHSPWPEEWNKEYIETIQRAVELHRNASHCAERLEILGNGFASYWESFKKISDRSFFELYCTRIRWYTEHLIGSEFPTEEDRQKLRDQYKDLWDYAANLLLKQFPFLDPNTVKKVKADDLSLCYRKIDTPLMPVYLRPMSEEHVEQIKQRWGKLRYARVDLLRRLVGNPTTHAENSDEPSSNSKRDYELTTESLSQLLGLVWKVVPQRPDYYLEAIKNRIEALKLRIQMKRRARSYQLRLQMQKGNSRQLLQIEHLSFMLAALLETKRCYDRNPPITMQDQSLLEQQDKTAKGGGVYEVDNVSPEK